LGGKPENAGKHHILHELRADMNIIEPGENAKRCLPTACMHCLLKDALA